jgi:hypothetical protein
MNTRLLLSVFFVVLVTLLLPGCTVKYVDPPSEPAYVAPPPPPPPPDVEFYELRQYGDWIDVHPFGTVWRPRVSHGWRPYVYGHWAWTDWDWTWVSYEPFGWAVYHYGYWHYDRVWGWVWIPGLEWEPVRVQWMYYGDYVCWAPLPPPGYRIPDPWIAHSTDVWVVVHYRNFTNYDLHRFRVEPVHYKYKYKQRMDVYRSPPPVKLIEKHTRRPIQRIQVDTRSYKSGAKTYKRVVLPDSEKRVVERYKPHVKKRAMKDTSGGSRDAYKSKKERTTPQQQKGTARDSENESMRTKSKTKEKDSRDSGSRSRDKDSGSSKTKKKKKKG